jgi:adenine-specific DNA-methyltransferase
VIKYLGSKRRLVPVLRQLPLAVGARSALDLFTGTTRVAQAFKADGLSVTALDSARYSVEFARCYVATDADAINNVELDALLGELQHATSLDGYVTATFCDQARFFHPDNGRRIDGALAVLRGLGDHPLRPVLLTALIEAADRVDSTTGLQMAYLKQWAPRARQPLTIRRPELLSGGGVAVLGDAVREVDRLGEFDFAYLDPPYNQHRYVSNYHVWETLAAGDEPAVYGKACKRVDLRADALRSVFNERRAMPAALADCIARVPAAVVAVSLSDESWVSLDDLRDMCAVRGPVEVLEFVSRRYVGSQIGVFNRSGVRVGEAGAAFNLERIAVCGELTPSARDRLRQLLEPVRA